MRQSKPRLGEQEMLESNTKKNMYRAAHSAGMPLDLPTVVRAPTDDERWTSEEAKQFARRLDKSDAKLENIKRLVLGSIFLEVQEPNSPWIARGRERALDEFTRLIAALAPTCACGEWDVDEYGPRCPSCPALEEVL